MCKLLEHLLWIETGIKPGGKRHIINVIMTIFIKYIKFKRGLQMTQSTKTLLKQGGREKYRLKMKV